MKIFRIIILLLIVQIGSVSAQDVTFADNVAEILYDNCTTCHRPGEIGPFPLTSYEEAASFANMIKFVTEIKYMPPWPPDPSYSHFLGERGLTDDEIQKLAQWADDGAPRGNPNNEPAPPTFPTGSQLGTPDLVLSFDESYLHKGNNADDYRVFVLPTGLAEDKIVKSIELRPGNRRIVHHALISYDLSGRAQLLDNATPEYGYQSFGGFGDGLEDAFTRQFPGYVPGQRPSFFPQGLGQVLPAGSDILIQIHYAPIAADESDSTSINIFFADEDEVVDRMVQNAIITPFTSSNPHLLNLPANQIKNEYHYLNIPVSVSVLAIWPHMHLLGKDWLVYSVHGNDTTQLVKIDDWDFNWQGAYDFTGFQVIPAGSRIHAYATYDNTVNNPLNPNDPPARVTWGERTTDEMFYLPISYVEYREGDEDIMFNDSTFSGIFNSAAPGLHSLHNVWPNPSREEIRVSFTLGKTAEASITIYDIQGKIVERIQIDEKYQAGDHAFSHDISPLGLGTYFVALEGLDKPYYRMFQKL